MPLAVLIGLFYRHGRVRQDSTCAEEGKSDNLSLLYVTPLAWSRQAGKQTHPRCIWDAGVQCSVQKRSAQAVLAYCTATSGV